MKRDFKKGPEKGNCFVCGISGDFAKDCRRKRTTQCSKCGEKGHLDRACKRKRDEGKHESVAMVQHWLSYPVKDRKHASGQWLYRSHSDEHRCAPRICAHSISGQKSQQRALQCGGQRLCEDQHLLEQRANPMRFQKDFACAGLLFKALISLQTSYQTEWGQSFTFEKGNSCMKLQKELG